ncbi:hypothetical protein [Longimycelium tulufanense]|uniref:hypothetical protein n=1 Tax=Longimycelium tulufanense TaxID=907463 RepID=UPI001669705D|nr:hypothetical protein [Longimycelium tulufanense]
MPGVYIGIDLYSRASFLFDPWKLYEAGVITSPNGLIIGEIGSGKSALNKSLLTRFAAIGVPFSWVDIKDEYTPVAQALGVEPLRLGPGLGVKLNPLAAVQRHPEQTDEEWRASTKTRRMALLEGLVHVRLDRPLTMTERTALELALDTATGELPGMARDQLAPASLPAVLAQMTAVDRWRDQLRDLGVDAVQLLDESRDARLALHNLVHGSLKGMFDAEDETTRYLDWTAPGTIVNLSAVRSDQAVTVMAMVCAHSAMEAELMRPGASTRIVGYDEAWLAMRYVPLLKRFQEQWKLARMYGLFNLLTFHRLSDLQAVGQEGSEAVRLARGLLEDTGVKIAYRQTEASLPLTREMFGLTDVQTQLLKYLRKGSAMWRLGGRTFVVQHLLSSVETPLVQTDSRMRAVHGVDDIDDDEWERLMDDSLGVGS